MKQIFNSKPYIILGVHRSGTTLMTNIFSRLGVFMGKNQNINKEAKFFFNLNNNALKENQSTAYDFNIFLKKLEDTQFINLTAKKFEREILQNINSKFFGFRQLLKYYFQTGEIKWGFKDPRTILLYPVWEKIFPEAKLLIIFRNPLDVCLSIYYFEQKRYQKKLKKRPGLKFGMPLTKAFEVWKIFTQLLLNLSENTKNDHLTVKYEDLKYDKTLKKIIQFTESEMKPEEIKKMIIDKPNNYPKPKGFEKLIELIKQDETVKKIYPNIKL